MQLPIKHSLLYYIPLDRPHSLDKVLNEMAVPGDSDACSQLIYQATVTHSGMFSVQIWRNLAGRSRTDRSTMCNCLDLR